MDKRFETYCMADPVFFEAPGRSGDAGDAAGAGEYAVVERPVPDGWRSHRGDLWLELHPEGEHMVDQGWKVHASGVAENAERIVETVWDFCVPRRYAFKFPGLPAAGHRDPAGRRQLPARPGRLLAGDDGQRRRLPRGGIPRRGRADLRGHHDRPG
ncbi:hypothetical protein PV707_00530 [Streptomyces europaeiscabiei]|nr:hypothetical protein [Streptomyces europaeiscabiei]